MTSLIEGLKLTLELYSKASLGGLLFTEYLVCAVILLLRMRREDKAARCWYIYPVLLLMLLFVNPVTVSFLCARNMELRVLRIYWLIPADVLVVYCVVKAYFSFDDKLRRAVVILAMVGILGLNGNLLRNEYVFKADNSMKIPAPIVSAADLILNDCDGQDVLVGVCDDTLLQWLRQYDVSICISEEPSLRSLLRQKEAELDAVLESAGESGCDYVIMNRDAVPEADRTAAVGCVDAGADRGYLVYRIGTLS